MLGKVIFDAQVNVLETYCEGNISYTFTKKCLSFQNQRSLKVVYCAVMGVGCLKLNETQLQPAQR